MSICGLCHLNKAELYCSTCVSDGLGNHQHVADGSNKQTQVATRKAYALYGPDEEQSIDAWRRLRAEVAASRQRCATMEQRIKLVQEALHESVRARESKSDAVKRQDILAVGRVDHEASTRNELISSQREQDDIYRRLVKARQSLVQGIVTAYGVQRSITGGWEISGLPLPPPQDFRLHSREHINGVLIHIVNLVSHICQYLDITLPYIPTYASTPFVGDPILAPNPPFNFTTEYRDDLVLRMSNSALATSKKRHAGSAQNKHRMFLTAYALLAHSVAYLATSQGVDGIGVSRSEPTNGSFPDDETTTSGSQVALPVTNILQVLHAMMYSPMLGRKSHSPGVQQMADLGFGLDVRVVVKWVLAVDDARWNQGEQSEEWDIIDGHPGQ